MEWNLLRQRNSSWVEILKGFIFELFRLKFAKVAAQIIPLNSKLHFMKTITNILIMLSATFFSIGNVLAQTDEDKVNHVLKEYQSAIEKLDTTGVSRFFIRKSQIIESGSIEGTFQHYLAHHLGPELNEFKSFKFSDYKTNATIDLPYAFVTESYKYTIVVKKDNSIVERRGVATSILKKENGIWKIMQAHSSSRRP